MALDATGRTTQVSRRQIVQPEDLEDRSQEEAFVRARGGTAFFSPVYFGPEAELYMRLAVPIEPFPGDVVGVLSALCCIGGRIVLHELGACYTCCYETQATQVRISQPYHATPRQRRGQIARLCAVIAREFHPDKIILFGSWAYGKPDTDSDIDLLIVMPFEGSPFRQAGTILNRVIQAVGVLPLDLLVRTAEQLDERLTLGDGFVRDILARGKVLYEADHA